MVSIPRSRSNPGKTMRLLNTIINNPTSSRNHAETCLRVAFKSFLSFRQNCGISLLQQPSHIHRRIGKGLRLGLIASTQNGFRSVAGEMRFTIDFDDAFGKIHDPDFLDSCPAIKRKLFFTIQFQRTVGDLYQKKNVVSTGRMRGIIVRRRFKQHNIGLRLGMFIQGHRVLRPNQPAILGEIPKRARQTGNDSTVKEANW